MYVLHVTYMYIPSELVYHWVQVAVTKYCSEVQFTQCCLYIHRMGFEHAIPTVKCDLHVHVRKVRGEELMFYNILLSPFPLIV